MADSMAVMMELLSAALMAVSLVISMVEKLVP